MQINTYINGFNGKKIRIRNCDLRLMDKEGAKWFVRKYRRICKIEDLYNGWYEQRQLKIKSNTSVYEKTLYEYKRQNGIISIQYIKDECSEIKSKLTFAGKTGNKIKLDEDTLLGVKPNNVDKINDLKIEREREECELIMENMLDKLKYLKEKYENRRIEVEENINKLGKIDVITEKIKSSVNCEVVQGYGKKEGKEKEREEEFQEVVSKSGADTSLISNPDGSGELLSLIIPNWVTYNVCESNNGLLIPINIQNCNYDISVALVNLNEVIFTLDSNSVLDGVNAFNEFNQLQDQGFTIIGTLNPTPSQTSNLIPNLFWFFIIDDGG